MRVFLAAAMIMILAGTAFAQERMQRYGETDKDKTPAEIAADKAAERAYRKSLGNIPDQGPTDPWGAVRTTDAPKPDAPKGSAAKTLKAKTKTGAASN